MRKLMWFTIGFALCCGFAGYGILHRNLLLPIGIGCLLLCALGHILGEGRNWLRRISVVLLGFGVGIFWFQAFRYFYLRPLDGLVDTEVMLEITASDYGETLDYGTRVDGILKQNGKGYQVRAYLNTDCTVQPGDKITGIFSLQTPRQEIASYFNGKGIYLFAYEKESAAVTVSEKLPFWCYPAILRHEIKSVLDACFPTDVVYFAKALLLGDTGEIPYATDTALKISGIRHIVAVSGLHISILYGLIQMITLRRRFLTALLGFPVLFLFSAVAGFTPSVVRAGVMIFLMLLAQLFDQEYDSPTALAFSVLLMLAVNPMAAVSASLQMSVACVAGILFFQQPVYRWLRSHVTEKFIPGWFQKMLCSSISVTVSATSLVTPLTALYFGTVSLISVLTNLLTLWVVSFLFYGIIAVCLLWWIVPSIATILASVLSWFMRYVLAVAELLADVPFAAVYTRSVYVVLWLMFVYVLLAVFLLQKKKHPAVLGCCMILGLCSALMLSWAEPLLDDTRITMLDVGQGQSILLQTEGKNWLVDCGGDSDTETSDTIAETLLSQGISRLDGIILTHYDRDHSGALYNLLTRIDTDLLILPDTRNDFQLPDTDVLWIWEDTQIAFGSANMTIFGPVYSGLDNENSLCVLFDSENCDILITGDRTAFGERMLMRKAELPDVDILVAGHHGAADSTSEELLRMVQPEIVLISVEKNNFYGHPSPELLRRLEAFGCRVLRTDIHGTITIRR